MLLQRFIANVLNYMLIHIEHKIVSNYMQKHINNSIKIVKNEIRK